MAVDEADILYKLSIRTGTAGDQNAQPDPDESLGKYVSTTQHAGGLNALFDDISGDENAASDVEYRCLFVHNADPTVTWEAVKMWIASEVAGGASVAIGVDPAAASPIGQATAQASEVVTEQDAPAGVTFSAPTTKAAGIDLGDIPAGHCRAVWVRRTAQNNAPVDNDGFDWRCEGDTGA